MVWQGRRQKSSSWSKLRNANVAALAAGVANRDFSLEREREFVLKRTRVGVDGRARSSRPRRCAGILAETLDVSHGHAFGDDAVGKPVRFGRRAYDWPARPLLRQTLEPCHRTAIRSR
jgi:hypothetical protein